MNLAPNGKPSKLTPEQYALVRTPAFKAWFGDWEKAYETGNYDNVSKVIDEVTKEPLVVYHGTPIGETNVFDFKKGEDSIVSSGLREYGMYFTTNKNIAKIYQAKKRLQTDEYKSTLNTLEEKRNKVRNNIEYDKLNKQIDFLYYGRIYEVFLNLKKIVSFDAKGMANVEAYYNLKVDVGYDIKQGREAMYFFKTGYSHAKSVKEVVTVEKVDGIRADNIIELSEYGALRLSDYEKNKYIGTSFLVFPKEKDVFYNIKLADGTNTTFDSNNPDIRYAEGGSVINRTYFDDGNKLVVFSAYRNYEPYKIAVNDVNNAEYITLWKTDTNTGKDKKVGALKLENNDYNYINPTNFLMVSYIEIDKSSRGLGLGLEMYKVALKYSADNIKGIKSYLPDRVNKRQIPKIYKALNGKVEDDDYAYIYKADNLGKFKKGGDVIEYDDKIFYHGTDSYFQKFDLSKAGRGEGSNKLGEAIYLTPDLEKAKEYGSIILEVVLRKGLKLIDYDQIKHQKGYYNFLDKQKKEDISIAKENFARLKFDGMFYGSKELIIFNEKNVKVIGKAYKKGGNVGNSVFLSKSENYGSYEGIIHYDIEKIKNWFLNRNINYSKYLKYLKHPIAFLNNINVDSKYRNKGYGSDLYSDFEQECYENDVKSIILESDSGEYQKKGFDLDSWYESFDFEIIGNEGGNSIMIKILDAYKKGGSVKNLSKTPAPKKDRIYGSSKNKPKSSESKSKASSIILSPTVIKSINTILKEHNEDFPKKKIPLSTAKAVVRRGMGAFSSSYRPTISGGKPNSRVAWGLARLKAFVYKIQKGHSKSGKYKQDNDLIDELGYKHDEYKNGGEMESDYSGKYQDLKAFIDSNDLQQEFVDKYNYYPDLTVDNYDDYVRGEITFDSEIIENLLGKDYKLFYNEDDDEFIVTKNKTDKLDYKIVLSNKKYDNMVIKAIEGTGIYTEYEPRFVVLLDNNVIGGSTYEIDEYNVYNFDLGIIEKYQGYGISNKLIEKIIQDAKKLGADKVKAYVVNDILFENLKRKGFDVDSADGEKYAFKNINTMMNGGGLDDLYKDHHNVWAISEKIIKNVCEENCSKYSDEIHYLYELELKPHFIEEEKVFFPSVINENNKDLIKELIKEHHLIKFLAQKIKLSKKTKDIKDFCNLMIEHIKKEELIMKTISDDPYKNMAFKNGGLTIKAPSQINKMPTFIAPNGNTSNLISIKAEDENGRWVYLYNIVRTAAFKNWFGDWEEAYRTKDYEGVSKIIDENGEPSICYHVTSNEFFEFDENYIGSKTDSGYYGKGFYFTEGTADSHYGEREIPCFLNIRNPLSYKSINRTNVLDTNELKDKGYDGVLVFPNYVDVESIDLTKGLGYHGNNIQEIVAYYPEQIKLADATNRTFDKYDSDIRYKNGGNIPKFDIESREGEEDRTTISIKGIGEIVLVETFPEYEFTEDIDEDTLSDLGLSEGDVIGKIEHIEIKDEYKGKGYAKLLMKKAIELAKQKGLMPLYLNASPMGSKRYGLSLEDLTGFYESFGFKVFLNQGNNNLMILKQQDVKFNEGGNIPMKEEEYKYFLVTKNQKPVFKVKFSKYKKETERDMSEMLDKLYDMEYILKSITEQEYKDFDYGTVDKEDIAEFTKNWSYYKNGGKITDERKETYKKWKSLVNMSSSELNKFLDSEEGKVAGLSRKEANELGIDYGRESARWILRMKDTPYSEWTPNMWRWAKKQISFISRMSGNKGKLFDENGKRTRKYLSLLVWGNNPLKK